VVFFVYTHLKSEQTLILVNLNASNGVGMSAGLHPHLL